MLLSLIILFFPVTIHGAAVSLESEILLPDNLRLIYPLERPFVFDRNTDYDLDVETEVGFHLFTNENNETAQLLRIGDTKILDETFFDPELSTKILVHGWTDNVDNRWYKTIRNNYLNTGNYNVIFVDWSSAAGREYFVSAKSTRPVGEHLGKFLSFLESDGNTSLSSVHILGHSLGAQVAGFAGSTVSGRIGRITGLDPAAPGFEVPFLVDPKNRLDPTDAEFVDVIHTCSGTVGFTSPIGHVDFYPNGGTFTQPGCPFIISLYCSHARSHQFWAESIIRPNGFLSLRCNGWKEFVAGYCGTEDDPVFMGDAISQEVRGTFYLRTNSKQPFGQNN
ncbi:pancreatic lipase-related protein 2-like [Athalia rosae]|uniref:pancreatic lipase-related protein 2-like n=1 Tax=Athalia rosae TaxID=37344 RepID=UPI0020337857|nr:pancreatic lipase-related protein 2-like [Athalia rosae]